MEAMTHGGSANDEDLVASEYLTFTLGSEEYAIDILKVQEIRGYEQPTLIANAPPFIKGVINLRGIIVPIVDLRIKFNLGKFEYTPFTVVIILNVAGRVIGAVVDSVSDVFSLTRAQIRPAPDFSGSEWLSCSERRIHQSWQSPGSCSRCRGLWEPFSWARGG